MPQVSPTPGGGTLVTSEYGGGRDKLAYAAEILNAFGEERRQREEEEKRRALQKAQFALESVGKGGVDPNSAVVRGAIDNVRKYDPETADLLAANLDAAAQERQAQQQSAAAGQRWMQGVERAEAPLRELSQRPQSLMMPGPGGAVMPMNPEISQQIGKMAAGQLPQVPRDVASQMPFPEREAARVWAEGRGFTFPAAPTPIDPYGSTFPADTRAHLAATQGLLPPEVAQGERIGRGLELSAGQQETSRLQDAAGRRADERLVLDREAQRTAKERLRLDQEKEARYASTESSEGAVKLGDVAKWLAADTTLLAKEWEAGLAEVMPKDASQTKKAAARAEYEATAGPRPEPLLKLQANRLSRAAVEDLRANGVENPTDAEVQAAVEKLQRAYLSLIAGDPQSGRAPMSRDEAVRFLLGDG